MKVQLISKRFLNSHTVVLQMERLGLEFFPGQFIHLGIPDARISREYSIYSSIHDEFIEVLIRIIPEGVLSPWFAQLSPGDELELTGPFGDFHHFKRDVSTLGIATGTGLSPFHCIFTSNPNWNGFLLHGIPKAEDRYEYQHFPADSILPCISREEGWEYYGRVTQWLRENSISTYENFMLCGNSDMIYEAFSILEEKGIGRDRILVESYF